MCLEKSNSRSPAFRKLLVSDLAMFSIQGCSLKAWLLKGRGNGRPMELFVHNLPLDLIILHQIKKKYIYIYIPSPLVIANHHNYWAICIQIPSQYSIPKGTIDRHSLVGFTFWSSGLKAVEYGLRCADSGSGSIFATTSSRGWS